MKITRAELEKAFDLAETYIRSETTNTFFEPNFIAALALAHIEALSVIEYYANNGSFSGDHSPLNPEFNELSADRCFEVDAVYFDSSMINGEPLMGRLAREYLSDPDSI